MLYLLVAILGAHEFNRRKTRMARAWRERNRDRVKFLTLFYKLLLHAGAVMVGIGGLVPFVGTLGWLVCGGVFLAATMIPCAIPAVNRVRILWYLREAAFLATGTAFWAHACGVL